ncbi:MAG: histidine phosphatase family protein [Pseudoalteromonas distincta]
MGSIYLIRHGQASLGAENYDVLSPLGIQQSEILGEHFHKAGLTFDRSYAGEMDRQIDTGKYALAKMPGSDQQILCEPAFNEYAADTVMKTYLPRVAEKEPDAMHYVENAGQYRKEFQKVFSQVITMWITEQNAVEGCEPWSAFVERVKGGLARVLEDAASGQNIAIFTSGGAITAALQLLTQMPATSAFELNWQIVNTSVSRLQYGRNKLSLASFNSQAHLDLHQQPDCVTYR